MIPVNFFLRLPPSATLLVLVAIFQTSNGHAIPQQTKTIAFHELEVQPWPLVPTSAPTAAAQLNNLLGRQLNTVCGYIGGDPSLPATCSAGSHCAVDVGQGAVGCCPDQGPCTQGVFTGCVDASSGPQTEVNPYVYSCTGSNICYRNTFEGGFYQFGCGSASDVAATVVATASGRPSIDLTSIEAVLTDDSVALSAPTTLGTLTSEPESSTTTVSTARSSSSEETTRSETETTTTSPTATTTSATETTTASSASSTRTSSNPLPTATEAPASDDDNDGGAVSNTVIIASAVGSIAGALVLAGLAFFLWRRRKGNTRHGPGVNANPAYIKPGQGDGEHVFTPLTPVQEVQEVATPPLAPVPAYSATSGYSSVPLQSELPESVSAATPSYQPGRAYGYSSGTVLGGGTAPGTVGEDEIPLTSRDRELDDFSRGFNSGLQDIREDEPLSASNSGTMSSYAMSRSGGRPLWQQNRHSQNPMWM
ncbi:hypothetical protein S40285_01466 [Stachybotrys chlorohalonatus IBT 40285]|uniref:Mid2 domain-containing protein n=1 Tax=Stachybotrys chlorohalonatus (strain IBT 40285) TaxID=1283841 RepID=A0A084QMJ3_STAC4|nr:hypothetical protein S40285_01466 [Stachybotrys chlorohalonata IBT 40285]